MKRIIKGTAPLSFDEWKGMASESWSPTYDDLQNPQKRELHQALLEEQGWVCCYCGRQVDLADSHIEHFRPQRDPWRHLDLEYTNLLASCIREPDPLEHPVHCGHAKGSQFDEASHVSPVSEGCELRFIYLLDGRELASEASDTAATRMIDVLKLNVAYLRNRRQEAIEGAFDNDFLSTASSEELCSRRDLYAQRDASGRFRSFAHVIVRYADRLSFEEGRDVGG
jgi:uncharacterized protein (TIGR02646 family)